MFGRKTLAAALATATLIGIFAVSAAAEPAGNIGEVEIIVESGEDGVSYVLNNQYLAGDGQCYPSAGRTAEVRVYLLDDQGLHEDPPTAVVQAEVDADGYWTANWTPDEPGNYLLKPVCTNPDGFYEWIPVTVPETETPAPTTTTTTTVAENTTTTAGPATTVPTEVEGVTTTVVTSGGNGGGVAAGATPAQGGTVAYTG